MLYRFENEFCQLTHCGIKVIYHFTHVKLVRVEELSVLYANAFVVLTGNVMPGQNS